jgi:hypothetical protein
MVSMVIPPEASTIKCGHLALSRLATYRVGGRVSGLKMPGRRRRVGAGCGGVAWPRTAGKEEGGEAGVRLKRRSAQIRNPRRLSIRAARPSPLNSVDRS